MDAGVTAKPLPDRAMDIIALFDPVDCRGLREIKRELADMEPSQLLEVVSNPFQEREIRAWVKRFPHEIVATDVEGDRCHVYIRRG